MQSATAYYSLMSAECFLSFLIGSCLTLQTISKDIKDELHTMDDINKTSENPTEFKQKMCEFVEFLSDARQLSELKSELTHSNYPFYLYNGMD